jgi:hypothetical protein
LVGVALGIADQTPDFDRRHDPARGVGQRLEFARRYSGVSIVIADNTADSKRRTADSRQETGDSRQ